MTAALCLKEARGELCGLGAGLVLFGAAGTVAGKWNRCWRIICIMRMTPRSRCDVTRSAPHAVLPSRGHCCTKDAS